MAPKQQQQMDDLIARVEQLEHANTINLNKIAELEKDNGLLSERITKLEENSRSKVLDFSKLFDKKGTKSVEEINLTQSIIALNKDASKRDKNVLIIGIPNSHDSDPVAGKN